MFLFFSWLLYNIETYTTNLKISNNIKDVNKRIEIEQKIFDRVRNSELEGKINDYATFYVKDNRLLITGINDSTDPIVYDIIGDGSFKWRKIE